jgi:hypothetical protein
MPADAAKTPPPAWLAPDIRAILELQVQIGKEGTATRVRALLCQQYRIHADALYKARERVGLEVPIGPAEFPGWLYATEQESIVEALLQDNPRDRLIRRLARSIGLLRLIDSEFPEAIVTASQAELDAARVEVELKPLIQSDPDPGLAQVELAAALVELEPYPLPAQAEPELGKSKRGRKPWDKVDAVIDPLIVDFGTPDKKERRRLIGIAEGVLAKWGSCAARSTVERYVDKRITKRKEELS